MMTLKSNNFYQFGGSLSVDAPTYVIRQADLDFYKALKAGKFCYVLNCRQMGKSSLRVRTMQRLQAEGTICACIDLTGIGKQDVTPEKWYAGLVRSLVSSCQLSETLNWRNWWRERRDLLSPVQLLKEFIESVLLVEVEQNVVIFVDEIDRVLSQTFSLDDFFSLIRFFCEQRVNNPIYERLTFALLGVATPGDLIKDKTQTPFNIGLAIALHGFELHEVEPLIEGLEGKVSNPQGVMREILSWTGGQPFLTQKLCKLVVSELAADNPPSVEQVVRSRIIENWEAQDEPEHLRTIRDRLLINDRRASRLLGLYQQILQQGVAPASDNPEQMELRLTGLVVKRQGGLRVSNPIYQEVFNLSWVEKELDNLRPYSDNFRAWLASNCQDSSRLLRGEAFKEAQKWAVGKSLSDEDYQFLAASTEAVKQTIELEKLEAQINLDAERKEREATEKANQILTEAKQKADKAKRKAEGRLAISSAILAISLVGATIAGIKTNQAITEAQQGTRLEQAGVSIRRQFESLSPGATEGEIDILVSAMRIGQELKDLVGNRPLEKYPAISPLYALRTILDQIRERNRLEGHQGSVNSVAFSPDGEQLATASFDGTARLWDLKGNLLAELEGHQGKVTSVAFSPDGEQLVTASFDGTARLWDLKENLLAELEGHQGKVTSVAFSPDGEQLATASRDRTARLWDLKGNLLAELEGHQGTVTSVAFSPDGEQLATASGDRTARLWDLKGNPLAEFKGHQSGVESVAFSPDGEQLATASFWTARLWDLKGNLLAELEGHQGWVHSVAFSPDGEQLATASRDLTARLWDLKGNLLAEFKGHRWFVESVAFSPDGELLATASSDHTARLWDLKGNLLAEFKGHRWFVESVAFSPDGELLATASSD
ncbi:MAG: AAA-like domain-containing protein, partial [Xenococcaceae cyanobacterium]